MIPTSLRLVTLLALLPTSAGAEALVKIRVGDHPGFGRIVFDWPAPIAYRVEEQGGQTVLHFAAPAEFDLSAVRRPVRNLQRIDFDGQTARLVLAEGARLRHFQLGERVVTDLIDPAGSSPAAVANQDSDAPAPTTPTASTTLSESGWGAMPAVARTERQPAASAEPIVASLVAATAPRPEALRTTSLRSVAAQDTNAPPTVRIGAASPALQAAPTAPTMLSDSGWVAMPVATRAERQPAANVEPVVTSAISAAPQVEPVQTALLQTTAAPEENAPQIVTIDAVSPQPAPPQQFAQQLPPLTPRPSPFQPRALQAQAIVPGQAPAAPPLAAPVVPAPATPVRLEAGTGRLLTLTAPATTVMAADPRVARVQPSSPTSVFVMAVSNGRTTVIATDDRGRPVAEFDVSVFGGRERGAGDGAGGLTGQGAGPAPPRPLNARAIETQIRSVLGNAQVRVRTAGRAMILSGTAANADEARRAELVARGMGNEDTEILNEIAVLSSIQVNLRVRVAEISRDLTRQFGINWSAIGSVGNFAFGMATGSAVFPVPSNAFSHTGFLQRSLAGAAAGGVLGDPQRLAGGYRAGSTDINGIIDALAADNLISVLAEPNLTAQSGEVASFLAGGEFPIPVAARDNSITIEFKPYGVSLAFVPIVLSNDRLTLRVRPEVSELTDQGAINLPTLVGTLRIPALSVRRAETTVELGSGQSFAIAGLLQRNTAQVQDGVNGLNDLPVLGALFRSDRFQRRETELVIIVTPYLVQPVSDPRALATPTDNFRPATSLERILRQRQLREGSAPVPALPPQLGFRLQ